MAKSAASFLKIVSEIQRPQFVGYLRLHNTALALKHAMGASAFTRNSPCVVRVSRTTTDHAAQLQE